MSRSDSRGSSQYTYLNRVANRIGIKFEYKTELPEFKVPGGDEAVEQTNPVATVPRQTSSRTVAWIKFTEVADSGLRKDEPRNLFRALSENSPARDGLRQWRDYQFEGTSALDVKKRAQIGLFISGLNRCQYSDSCFSRKLRELGPASRNASGLARGGPWTT